MEKVLITGANGMLSKDLYKELQKNNKFDILALDKQSLNITDKNKVKEVFENYRPNYVIHTAALTDVDYCEENMNMAIDINSKGTENIAFCGNKINSKLIYISSCGLFGDEIKEYSENDELILKTNYAISKYLGEEYVKDNCEKYYIIRPGWLFGGDKTHNKNFVYKRYLEGLNKKEISSAIDKYGCPTYTSHLSNKIIELMNTDLYGLYHVSNEGHCSRYEYVKEIIDAFKLNTQLNKVTSDIFPRKAPVPDCEILKNQNLKNNGFDILPNWKEAIHEYISKLIKEM